MKNKALLTGLCILLAEFFVAVLLWLFGFRITYAPSLENSWDAISACAAWAGVVTSFVAIIVAIQIPRKIADRQNKIALFEKRHAFYDAFCRCISFSESLDQIQTCEEARRLFYVMLSDDSADYYSDSFNTSLATVQIKTAGIINQGLFLFPFETDAFLEAMLKDMVEVLSPRNSPEEFSKYCGQLKESTKVAKEQLLSKVEAILGTINKT